MNTAFVYRIYTVLVDAEVPLRTKQRTLEEAASDEHAWRVVGVTTAAIDHIRTTGSTKGLRRGHAMERAERARRIFERDTAMSELELADFFLTHDSVTLVTAGENGRPGTGHWSRVIPVPKGIFASGSFSIRMNKKDRSWVAGLAVPPESR